MGQTFWWFETIAFFAQQYVAIGLLIYALKLLEKSSGSSCFCISCSVHFKNYSTEKLFNWTEKLNILQAFIFVNVGFYFQDNYFSECVGAQLILLVYFSNWEKCKWKIVPYKLNCFFLLETVKYFIS